PIHLFFSHIPRPLTSTLFPYTTLFRSHQADDRVLRIAGPLHGVGAMKPTGGARELDDGRLQAEADSEKRKVVLACPPDRAQHPLDRKSTRLNSSHVKISYAVFCLKKKN